MSMNCIRLVSMTVYLGWGGVGFRGRVARGQRCCACIVVFACEWGEWGVNACACGRAHVRVRACVRMMHAHMPSSRVPECNSA
eukprot:scaffold5571_cov142-Isochrysis_galbana.AAC.1